MKLVFATGNPGKLREASEILGLPHFISGETADICQVRMGVQIVS